MTNFYSEIMDKVYYNLLKTYLKETSKLSAEIITKTDLIIQEETKQKANEFQGNLQVNTEKESEFEIEERLKILGRIEEAPMVSYISQQKLHEYPFEEIFRSQNRLLIEAISKEFVFVLEFFDLKMGQCSYLFNQIFSRIVNYYLEWLKAYVGGTVFDVYAMLLMIQINEENKTMLHKNKIPVLDFYFDKVNMILWPRFTQIFEIYLDNINKAQVNNFKLYNQPILHVSVARFVEFVRGLYRISNSTNQDMLTIRLTQARDAMVRLCGKMGEAHFSGEKEKVLFLLNNYDFIYSSLKALNLEKGIQDVVYLEKMVNTQSEGFIKILLKENFSGLDSIV